MRNPFKPLLTGFFLSPKISSEDTAGISKRFFHFMSQRRRAAAMSLLLASIGGVNATALEVASNSQLEAFTRSPFYSGFLAHTFASLPPEVFHRCPALNSAGSRVAIMKPVTFAPDGYPNSGVWRQDFPISGCGNDTTLHFYFSATGDEKINTVIAAPGGTHAELLLQNDAIKYSKVAIATLGVECANLYVTNTKFDAYDVGAPMDPPKLRSWHETWTMAGCGHTYQAPISFVPDATGTKIIPGRPSATN